MALLQIQEPVLEQENNTNAGPNLVIGIDLGTTNSLVAIIVNDKPHIFADAAGHELHRSVVAFDDDGNVLAVGNKAIKSQNTINISSIKRLMGKGFTDVKNNLDKFPFKFDESLDDKDSLHIIIGKKKYSPAEISAQILKYLKDLAQKSLDTGIQEYGNTVIQQAVITVPAYFDEAAKNATKLAAQLAGLEVLRLVSEPTAAALAYGLDNSSEGIYAVYDLGGGTFDVSVLKMQKGVFKVLGVSGDTALGGDDFDEAVSEYLKTKPRIPHVNNDSAENISDSTHETDMHNTSTIEIAREIKEQLSAQESASVNGFTLSRSEFENIITQKINHTIELTKKLLNDLDLEPQDLKGIILVGGSSRIPLIHKKLCEIFEAQKIFTNLDPDRTVAIGAAWQAYNLSGGGNNLLLDVIPLSLGIEMMGGIVEKIISRNATIPTTATKEFTTYADNQTGIKLHIVQGEREFAKDCRSLAEFEIKNIPPMKAGVARVSVSFKVDADGLLTITAQEKTSGITQEILVKPSYGINTDKVREMLLDSMKNSADDIHKRLLVQTQSEAKQNIMILERDLQDYSQLVEPSEKEIILNNLQDLKKLVELDDRNLIIAAQEKLEQSTQEFILRKLNQSLQGLAKKKIDDM